STFHVSAAAVTSISRAVAPALRSGSHELRIALLPPVRMMRDQPAGFSGMGPSRMVDQSASSSSARMRASPVWEPWPISDRSIVSVTIPSAPMRNQALGANGGGATAVAKAASARHGRANAMIRPVVVSRNSRRVVAEPIVSSESVYDGPKSALGPSASLKDARSAEQGLQSLTNRRPASLCHLPDRQLPDPLARSREDRVADRRRDRRRTRLPDAALRIGARYDVDLHHRHLGEAEHAVVVEVALLYATLVD